MSGRTAKAARRAMAQRYAAASPPHIQVIEDPTDRFTADGGSEVPVARNPMDIRHRLGARTWGPPMAFATGWRYQRYDNTGIVLVTAARWPELPDVPIIHASISRHAPVGIPTYDDLQLLHRAVWPDGHAMQCFVPPDDHINIRSNVLHLWGAEDGRRLWPIDFGRYGTI